MRYNQPQDGPLLINSVSSLSRGLMAAVTSFGDAVTRSGWSYAIGSSPIAVGTQGKFFNGDSATAYVFNKVAYVPPPFTITVVANINTGATNDTIVSFGGAGGGAGWRFQTGSSNGGSGGVVFGGVGVYDTTTTSYFIAGSWHVYTLSVVGTTASFYRDGKFIESITVGTPAVSIYPLAICALNNSGGWSGSSQNAAVAILHSRGLSVAEIKTLASNPWQIFKSNNKVLKAASGTTNASLTTTDAQDVAALSATVTTGASVAAVDGADVAALTALNWTIAGIAATDGGDIVALSATVTTGASLSTIDGFDIAAVTASIGSITSASIISADGADNASVHAANWTNSFLSTFDGADSLAILGRITTGATITGTDGADNAVIASLIWTNSALSLLDGWDAATITAQTGQTIAGISLQDWPDSAIINTSFHVNYILASITVNDYALNALSISNYAPWSINMSDFS